MRNVSKIMLISLLLVVTAGGAQAVMTVDGLLGDWAAKQQKTDPGSALTTYLDMIAYGAKFEAGSLYAFCTIDIMIDNDADGVYDVADGDRDVWVDNGVNEEMYFGLFIDADGTTGASSCLDNYDKDTELQDGGVVDDWDTMGVDALLEWGTDGIDEGTDYVNYWGGTTDDIDEVHFAAEGSWGINKSTVEWSVPVLNLYDCLQKSPDDVVQRPGNDIIWRAGIGCQGDDDKGTQEWSWGYDLSEIFEIRMPGDANLDGLVNATDYSVFLANWTGPAPAGDGGIESVPEPVTVSLLALGGLALLRRRR